MRRPPIEKLRRLTLAVALIVLLATAAAYSIRAWRAYQARKGVRAVAGDIRQQAHGFTFSRSEAGQTLFVIEASRTIERQAQKTILEEVSVIVYGANGNRADEIRTGRCEYDASAAEQIVCPDPVTFDLAASVSPRSRETTDHRLRIETSRVRFDQATGVARTPERVTFEFPGGHGQGVGLRYQPGQPAVVLEREVEIVLPREGEPPLRVRGRQLAYNSQQRLLQLQPPLSIALGDRQLVAEALTLALNSTYQVERVEAGGGLTAQARSGEASSTLRAEHATAEFTPAGGLTRVRAHGQVELVREGGSREILSCRQVQIHFHEKDGWVERVLVEGDARLRSFLPQETRELAAEKIELSLHPGGSAAERVVTHSRGVLATTLADGERRQIEAEQIELGFDENNRLTTLAARGQVESSWQVPGQPIRRTTSEELRAEFTAAGALAWAEQWGEFRYREETRQATAGRARYEAERGVFLLTQQPTLWDDRLRLTAQRVALNQRDAGIAATGDVRTTYAGRAATRLLGSALPVHLTAQEMHGERNLPGSPGWARYSGQARLWQGDNRLEADTIELGDSPASVLAYGDVKSFLVQSSSGKSSEMRLLRVASPRFAYSEPDRRGLFTGGVRGEGVLGSWHTEQLEVFLSPDTRGGSAAVDRARASGGVVIEQAGRRAQAENAEYEAVAQTIVLWGGEPELADAQYGTTRGARLTFRLADDTILIESGAGSRVVTRRTWAH
ncbi:MAG: LPS export ABC transporter periplasmic protein LptC [Acidobacteria bacterium]|nr:LPS export ABC transporter periplasmic protein LptC [Acidobacteriota bacterium]